MEFDVKEINLKNQYSDCVVVGIFEKHDLSIQAKEIDKISNGYITMLLDNGEMEGKLGQTLLLYTVPNLISKRVLLIGCGKRHDLNINQYRKIILKIIHVLNDNTGTKEAFCFLIELQINKLNFYWKIRQTIEIIQESLYIFDKLKSNKKHYRRPLNKMIFNLPMSEDLFVSNLAIQHSKVVSAGIKIAKDLGNMPPNLCNTSYLVLKAHFLEKKYKNVTTKIINEEEMKKLGMNAYLAVGKGSDNESLMSVIEYKGNINNNMRPIIFIGKGLIFDTGGISIKPSNNMHEMKYDMCGAAVVYGLMQIIAELNLPINVIGILAGCENSVSSASYRPGDVLRTLSGKTVEIINTDAEGRLVLCDVLTYVERFNPEIVIDIATLTGACVIALGYHVSGLISNCNTLANELIYAAKETHDHAWNLPLLDEFKEQLKSNIADISNVGGNAGGAITAGAFLSNFTHKYKWAHLDIAGTAWYKDKNKGATGRPIAMLSQFIINYCSK